LPVAEIQIGDTPVPLGQLTLDAWRRILQEVYECLDGSRGHRCRALQTVTLNRGPAEKYVLPHLHFERVLWRGGPPTGTHAVRLVEEARAVLQPLY
jgi:hypothetical protein